MKILKRTGNIEDFQEFKIITSIKNSAMDCNFTLNKSDINILLNSVKRKITRLSNSSKDRIISSMEIKLIIFETLNEYRFEKIAKAYFYH